MTARGREERGPILIVTEEDTKRGYLQAIRDHQSTREIRAIINAKGGGGVIGALKRTKLDAYSQIWIARCAGALQQPLARKLTPEFGHPPSRAAFARSRYPQRASKSGRWGHHLRASARPAREP